MWLLLRKWNLRKYIRMIIELICDIYAFETLKSNCAATQTLKKKKEKENMNNIYIYITTT